MFSFNQLLRALRRLVPGIRRRRKRVGIEALETRTLLSGNVTATLVDGNLFLTGDTANNSLKITVTDGNLVVTGTDTTTINGSANSFTLASAATVFGGSVFASLGQGDDGLQIDNNAEIDGGVVITDLQGTTKVGINQATVGGSVVLNTAAGADILSLDDATVEGSVVFNASSGNNLLSIANSTIAGNVVFNGERGEDDVVIEASTINGNTLIDTGDFRDRIAVTNTTLNGNLLLLTGRHNDSVQLDGVTVTGRTDLILWLGSDAVRIQGTNNFQGDFFAGGLLGKTDALQVSATSTFGGLRTELDFEASTVDTALFNTQITNGAIARAAQERSNLGGTPLAALTLTTNTSTNTLQTLSGEQFTQQTNYTITGTTFAGATVAADLGSGAFTTATATADATGNYSIVVPLANGENTITLRSTDRFARTTTQSVSIRSIQGSIMELTSNLGTFQVELFDTAAPISVANFKSYLNQYDNSIIHRVAKVADSGVDVIQGGGAVLNGNTLTGLTTSAAITNEASTARPNVRGTLAMARTSSLNSATSQWFVNVVNNTALDAAANPFAVFGRVIGTGMTVVDAIYNLPINDISTVATIAGVGLTNVPLTGFEPINQQLTGTASTTSASTTVVGVGTLFNTEFAVGDVIRVGTVRGTVASITSDTELVLSAAANATQADVNVFTNGNTPVNANYVVFSNIAEILG